jgi:predicted nucleotidyltransferase
VTPVAPTPETLRTSLLPLWEAGQFQLVVLFGSWAKGMGGPGSDLDLGFLPSGDMDEIGLTAEVVRLTHWNEVDVVDLRHADPLTGMEIARSGLLLFARDPSDFTEFRSLAFRRYVDSEKLRRAQREALDRFEQRHEPR